MTEIDNLLQEDDYEKINDMVKIKKTLKSCMDIDLFIEKAIKVIDESKNFNFRSERSKKFIDRNDPTFILKCDSLDLTQIDRGDLKLVNDTTDLLTRKLSDEVLVHINNFITDCVVDKEKFNSLFKGLPEDFSNTFLTNIYIVRLSIAENSIILKYFI